ncbi:hypothetical protein [Streptomyces sp. NPDC054786]
MVHRSATEPAPVYPAAEGPMWAGWVYVGLAALAGAQLLATVLRAGSGEPALLPSLVGVIAFPALAAGSFLRTRRSRARTDLARDCLIGRGG